MALSIELTDVVRQYRAGGQPVRALNGLSLRINGGQFTSIVGPSGAGKSTLLHVLGALDSPDSGSIRFGGIELATMTDDEQSNFRRRKVGLHLPVLQPVADPVGVGERGNPQSCLTDRSCDTYGPMPSGCSNLSDSAIASITAPASCPVARCSALPWRGR